MTVANANVAFQLSKVVYGNRAGDAPIILSENLLLPRKAL
jgi:hypothetical protein